MRACEIVILAFHYVGQRNHEAAGEVPGGPTLRLAVNILLLTMVRKSELTDVTRDEINHTSDAWAIPEVRMKRGLEHGIYRCLLRLAFPPPR